MAVPKPITIILTEVEIQRFWSRVKMTTDQSCWEWTGNTQRGHRLPYGTVKLRPWPLQVCHHCDNPRCCRPDHLFKGTPKENQQDMVRKGRATTGDRNGNRKHPERTARGTRQHLSKLTDEGVRTMREMYASGDYSYGLLARMFGVQKKTARWAISGRTWKHVRLDTTSKSHRESIDPQLPLPQLT